MNKIRLGLITLFLVIGLIFGSFPVALAQEAAEAEKDVFILEEIVITAQNAHRRCRMCPFQ